MCLINSLSDKCQFWGALNATCYDIVMCVYNLLTRCYQLEVIIINIYMALFSRLENTSLRFSRNSEAKASDFLAFLHVVSRKHFNIRFRMFSTGIGIRTYGVIKI